MLMLRRMLRRMRMSLIMSLADFCLTDSLREECGHHQSQVGMGGGSGTAWFLGSRLFRSPADVQMQMQMQLCRSPAHFETFF